MEIVNVCLAPSYCQSPMRVESRHGETQDVTPGMGPRVGREA